MTRKSESWPRNLRKRRSRSGPTPRRPRYQSTPMTPGLGSDATALPRQRQSYPMGSGLKTGTDYRRSFESLLAWRCGYASGLHAALTMLQQSTDPAAHIKRAFSAATAEAQQQWAQLGRPSIQRD